MECYHSASLQHARLLTSLQPICIPCKQVVALMVRSMARIGEASLEPSQEIDYAVTINRALPSDIRILGWAPIPADFSARWLQFWSPCKQAST